MDAVLLVGFGGPESTSEVMPFLRRVTAGRNVPDQRLALVAEHYYARDGLSPINAQNRQLVAALSDELATDRLDVFWGNRNSAPWLTDAFSQMVDQGVTRAVVVLTSAYSSYSGCRQYRENLAEAGEQVTGLEVIKIPAYYNAPGFVRANLENLRTVASQAAPDSRLLFTTHSIPDAMADRSGPGGGQYVAQHRALADYLVTALAQSTGRTYAWDMVYQSRSGPPTMPWLEPDINDHLRDLATSGVSSVMVVPIGFVSDHMEVIQDLDTEAAATAQELGLAFHRVPTVGDHPLFVKGLADWVRAVRDGRVPETVFGAPLPTPCLLGCCPNPRGERPALCEEPA